MTMNEKEIREKFAPRKCESQAEFDRIMSEMNVEQEHLNHPYLDQERELLRQIDLLNSQKAAIFVQINTIQMRRRDIEYNRKEINRVFHDLKHQLIQLNPHGSFPKKEEND